MEKQKNFLFQPKTEIENRWTTFSNLINLQFLIFFIVEQNRLWPLKPIQFFQWPNTELKNRIFGIFGIGRIGTVIRCLKA